MTITMGKNFADRFEVGSTWFQIAGESLANFSALAVAALTAHKLGMKWHAWASLAVLLPLANMEWESTLLGLATQANRYLPPAFHEHLNMLNVVAHVAMGAYAWSLRDRLRAMRAETTAAPG